MTRVIALAALVAMTGTASLACSTDDMTATSAEIADVTRDLVQQDASNLDAVMSIKMRATIADYHADTPRSVCQQQNIILDALLDLELSQQQEDSARL